MRPEFLCHLPFLRLDDGSPVELAGGARLAPLPFEEWLLLEDPAMDYHERRYRKVAPLFLRAPLTEGDHPGELSEDQERTLDEISLRAHTAAILALPATPIAPPSLSTSYVVWRALPCDPPNEKGFFGPPTREPVVTPDDQGIQLGRIVVWLQQPITDGAPREQWVVERRFGPAQREWLLSGYAAEYAPVSPEQAAAFANHYDRLTQAAWGPRRAAAVRCADALTALLTPDLPLHEAIVLIVASLENLVNPQAHRPLGDTFARRCAAWFAEQPDERRRDQPRFRRLYGARSDILHGANPADATRELRQTIAAPTEHDLHVWLRLHLWLALDWLVAWYGQHPDDDGGARLFQQALAAATTAPPDQWPSLRSLLIQGRTHGRG